MSETNGLDLIRQERENQIARGWTPEHDDAHEDGSLLDFAVMLAQCVQGGHDSDEVELPESDEDWVTPAVCHALDKHPDPVDRLRIAGALIVAEIERRMRRAAPTL